MLYKIYKSNTSNYPRGCAEIYEQSITTLGTANGTRTAPHPSKSALTDIKALTGYCTSFCSILRGGQLTPRDVGLALTPPPPFDDAGWRCSSWKAFCIYGGALMPRCPTFMLGLNLCPQMRQINPDSADIISCSTLWHRRNSQRPHFLQQHRHHLFFFFFSPPDAAGSRFAGPEKDSSVGHDCTSLIFAHARSNKAVSRERTP